jgi:hypothetical protein
MTDFWKREWIDDITKHTLYNKDLYSKSLNIRFYHIPKNAMTSIINSTDLTWVNIESIKNVKVVAVIREPFDRFVSSYLEVVNNRKNKHLRGERIRRSLSKGLIEEIYGNPDKYLNEILENGFWDGHQLPQTYYLNSDIHGRSIDSIDEFVTFDKINDYFKNLRRHNAKSAEEKKMVKETFLPRKDEILNLYEEDNNLWKKINK